MAGTNWDQFWHFAAMFLASKLAASAFSRYIKLSASYVEEVAFVAGDLICHILIKAYAALRDDAVLSITDRWFVFLLKRLA